MTLPMALIPTVCGAVKILENKKSRSPDLNEENVRDVRHLKDEGLQIATEAMQRAFSKKVLEMTSNGNFRLTVITDKKAAFDMARSLYSDENIYGRKIIGKMKKKPVNNLPKRSNRLRAKKGLQKTQQKGRKLRGVTGRSHGRVQKRTITKRGRKKRTEVLSQQNLSLGNENHQDNHSNTECVTRQYSRKDLEENLSLGDENQLQHDNQLQYNNNNQQDNYFNTEIVTRQCSRKNLEENLSLGNKNQQDNHANTTIPTRRCTRQSKLR